MAASDLYDRNLRRGRRESQADGSGRHPPIFRRSNDAGGDRGKEHRLDCSSRFRDLEPVRVPVGGGGLIGAARVQLKKTRPGVRIIGVQAAAVPSWKPPCASIVPRSCTARVHHCRWYRRAAGRRFDASLFEKSVDELLMVEDEEIAMRSVALEKAKTVAGSAGAAALSCAPAAQDHAAGQNVAVIVSGGNLDGADDFAHIERGMVKDGRLVRVRVELPDHPGGLENSRDDRSPARISCSDARSHVFGRRARHTIRPHD